MRSRIFFTAFLLSLPFWWGMNLLEKDLKDFFFWQELGSNTQVLTAQVSFEKMKPSRIKEISNLDIEAKSAVSVLLRNNRKEKMLFKKNTNEELPIASLTKLMTALIVLENYDLEKEISITKEAISQEGTSGQLSSGRVYSVGYLLYPLLMESSNDAAFALANSYEGMDLPSFIQLMNSRAETLESTNTYFFNPSGLEPDEDKNTMNLNYSTAEDLVKLTKELLKNPEIWQILGTPTYSLYGPELKNTNDLLFDNSITWKNEIIGGKTGYTEKAGGCIVLVLKAPENKGYLINIVLGTENNNERFNQMKKLVEWVNSAYQW